MYDNGIVQCYENAGGTNQQQNVAICDISAPRSVPSLGVAGCMVAPASWGPSASPLPKHACCPSKSWHSGFHGFF